MKLTKNFLKKMVEEVLNEQPPAPPAPTINTSVFTGIIAAEM